MAEKYSSLVFVVLLAMESAFGVASNTTMPTGGTTSAAAIMIAGNTTATFTTRTTTYRPFTTTVPTPVPSYPTTTTPPQGSNTAPPVHTVKPVLKVFGKIALLWFNQSLTFQAAQNSCISHQARLLHNATLSSLYFNYAHAFFLPISSFKNDQGSVRPTPSPPLPPTFWYISGAYNTTALQYNNGTCEMWVSGFNYRPCNHTATYFCMRKIPDCYPEMGEACDANQRCVVYLNGSAGCACNQGYTKTPASSCRDINECRTRPRPCFHRRSTCRNYEGGYTCVCPTGLVGNVCGYKITMQQLLKGLIYKPLMSNQSSSTYKRNAHNIIKSLKRTAKKYILSIRGLELVEMLRTRNSTTIIYDVYTTYKSVTSSTVLEFFKESKRRNGSLFRLYNADLPSQAPPICYRGFVKSTWENRTLEFPATPADVTSFNIGACVTEDWYALIQCRRPTTIGHSPYFDRHTLMRRPCGQGGVVPVMAPNESVGKKAVTTRVDQTLQLIAALSRLNSTWPPTSSQPASPLPTSSPPASSQPTSTIIGQLTDDVIKYNVTVSDCDQQCLF
uniref:uncharacterized protein LOC104266571 n=1 Tax=Ciona intestinalis TaxID=7719 RepID=UPI000521B13C|nr:uncharacterized protein LOC104266571 [Ciona intestinalis]|eukprot:XP_018671108.2 uncharacterized protein LOC104266571 [Ciona intestinalis]